jgi:hypothetical protein
MIADIGFYPALVRMVIVAKVNKKLFLADIREKKIADNPKKYIIIASANICVKISRHLRETNKGYQTYCLILHSELTRCNESRY